MKELRGNIKNGLNEEMLRRIKNAPKPTKTAEALAVVKEFDGNAISLSEIAEIVNIANPGRDERAKSEEYCVKDLRKHPELRVVATPNETYVRYVKNK